MDSLKKNQKKRNFSDGYLPKNFPDQKNDQIPDLTFSKPLLKDQCHRKPVFCWKKILGIFLGSIFLIFLLFSSLFLFRIYTTSQKISLKNEKPSLIEEIKATSNSLFSKEKTSLVGQESGRINILLLGIAGEEKPGNNLTDTIMLASIDTKNKKVALLSLPRDLYVEVPDSQSFAKINSLYQIGLKNNQGAELIKKSVEQITNQKIGYYLIVDFDGFTKFIDTLDGVRVEVERDIFDPRYPGPNYSYETFEIKKGWQDLNGATALKYARERHADPEGDFGRAKRQQQILQAVKNKAFSVKTFLNPLKINEILNTLEENLRTNLTLGEIENFLALSQELDTQNISTQVVDAWKPDSLLKVAHVYFDSTRAFVLVPKVGSYSQIQDLSENIFNQEIWQKRKIEFSEENPTIVLVNESGDSKMTEKIRSVLQESLGIKSSQIQTKSSSKLSSRSEVVDHTQGQKIFSLDEIIKIIPASLIEEEIDPSSIENYSAKSLANKTTSSKQTDFTLYLGRDLVEIYDYEEVDLDQLEKEKDEILDFQYPSNLLP